jgi:hypothetical protein
MDVLSEKELKILLEGSGYPAISLYMPTHRTGETSQDQIRLKNLLGDVETQLKEYGFSSKDIKALLLPLQELLSDTMFWQHQRDGLVIFSSPKLFRRYRFPYGFKELVVVGERFHIKPLLTLFSEDSIFYLLAISQNRVRFFECTRYSVEDITPDGIPASLAEATKYDQPQKQHQLHTTGPSGATIYHGQGISKDFDKDAILRYFQQIDQGLHKILRGEKAPLVLAAVDYLHPIYKQANSYQNLLEDGIIGNPDELSGEDLKEKGWAIIQPYNNNRLGEVLGKYRQALGTGLAANDIEQVVLAAYDGRVATLFVALGIQRWGWFDEVNRRVKLFEEKVTGAGDMLDFTAVNTLIKGGNVYTLDIEEMPGNKAVAALLRY